MARIRPTRLLTLSRSALACAVLLTIAASPLAHAKKAKTQAAPRTTAAQTRQAAHNPAGLPANVALAFA
ncbi:D-alanyl-D-alanine carboxypeptidase, partial [Klebsiella michiganensis]